MDKIKNKGQAILFKNSSLEILTKTSPYITLSVYIPIISLLLIFAYEQRIVDNLFNDFLIFMGALFFLTLFEYLMHRYVFYFITDSSLIKRFHYMVHGVHHEYPRDKDRLFMPPVPALFTISILYFIFYLLMGPYTYVFLPGFLTGYLIYAFMHYFMHSINPPKFLKPIWRHHALHHYKYPDKAFGVSSPLWDYIFGTMPPK